MQIDKTTFNDLSILDHNDEFSIFHKLDLTLTVGGRDKLKIIFNKPLNSAEEINGVQHSLGVILKNKESWPQNITNGTLMVIQKFYESSIDRIPHNPSLPAAYLYKIFHGPDFKVIANEPDGILDKNSMKMIDVQVKSDIFAAREEAEAWLDNLLTYK